VSKIFLPNIIKIC